MYIIVGLGNPGTKFKNTPHNIGFAVIDKLAIKNNFAEFELDKKSESLVSLGVLGDIKVVLVKPQTFMNESGKTAKKLLSQNKEQEILVVHDDIDLALGQIKISKNRSSAGHKGVESIIKAIGNENFIRIRIGVMPIEGKSEETEKFILKKFSESQKNILNEITSKAVMAIETLTTSGLEKAMNEYNK